MRLDVAAVFLHDFARNDAHHRRRENEGKVVIGGNEMDAKRVAIDHFQARDLGIVVEAIVVFLGARLLVVESDNLAVEQESPRKVILGIEKALDRIREVGGDQFAACTPLNAGSGVK